VSHPSSGLQHCQRILSRRKSSADGKHLGANASLAPRLPGL
jgi:hypothetical protein